MQAINVVEPTYVHNQCVTLHFSHITFLLHIGFTYFNKQYGSTV